MTVSQVILDLQRFGPDGHRLTLTLSESEAYCRRLALAQYENFPVASWLIPAQLRQHFFNVYGFCRWADDLGDETGDPARARFLLAWWQRQLEACYAGEVQHPVFVALAQTIREFGIPMKLFADLISAFLQDQDITTYENFDQLQDYCRRSADPVGRIILYLCKKSSLHTIRLSDQICTGLQLANFWQDIGRDLQIGRIYLPREDLRRFEYTESDLRQLIVDERFRTLLAFQVDRAKHFLAAGQPLRDYLPGRIGAEIDAIVRGGLMILKMIERQNYDVLSRRPQVKKAHLLGSISAGVFRKAVRGTCDIPEGTT